MKYEYCCKCDCATGKAGAGDDSLYTETDGPFCEDCFPEFKSKQEQDELVYDLLDDARAVLEVIVHDQPDDTFSDARALIPKLREQLGLPPIINFITPQQRKPLTDDEFLELLLRKGNSELLHYTTFVGGSIQMQGKIGLLKSAKVIKEFIEEYYGIKE